MPFFAETINWPVKMLYAHLLMTALFTGDLLIFALYENEQECE